MCRFPATRSREECVVESPQIEEDEAICDGPSTSDIVPPPGHDLADEVDSEIEPQHPHGKVLAENESISDDDDDTSEEEGCVT
jgi:hypothetical protein